MIAYLKKEDVGKETELENLKEQVRDVRTQAHQEREALMEDFSQKIAQLEAAVSDKDEEVSKSVLQNPGTPETILAVGGVLQWGRGWGDYSSP